MNIVITSGYFDPLHVGHIEYMRRAHELGECNICIVNNDVQATLKKGKPFMKAEDRAEIMKSLRDVNEVVISEDSGTDVSNTIRSIYKDYGEHNTLIFAKGGDRCIDNIPEAEVCRELGIYIVEGLGDKIRSSSDFIKEAKEE